MTGGRVAARGVNYPLLGIAFIGLALAKLATVYWEMMQRVPTSSFGSEGCVRAKFDPVYSYPVRRVNTLNRLCSHCTAVIVPNITNCKKDRLPSSPHTQRSPRSRPAATNVHRCRCVVCCVCWFCGGKGCTALLVSGTGSVP